MRGSKLYSIRGRCSMETYDVVIVGAGPAGSSLAYLLQKDGISVCLLDKSSFPRTKLCGGLLTEKTVSLYSKIYNEEFDQYTSITSKVNLYDKLNLLSSVETNAKFFFVDRENFDFLLVNKYLHTSGIMHQNTKIMDVDFESRVISLQTGKKIRYSVLVGADGALSKIRSLMIPSFKPNALCVEVKLPLDMQKNEISIFFSTYKQGYGWVFPSNIGIGGPIDKSTNMVKCFDEFATTLNCSSNLKKKGAPICFGQYLKKPGQNHVIFIGDAAGLTDPLTGEGIYFAFLSATMAFEAIHDSKGMNYNNACSMYNQKVKYIHTIIDDALFFKKWFLHSFFLKMLRGKTNIIKYVCENLLSNYNISYRKFPLTYCNVRRERKKNEHAKRKLDR